MEDAARHEPADGLGRTGAASPGAENPLLSSEPGTWDRLIEATGPASMLVWIRSHMGERARVRTSAEDIWQETLLHAWQDRERLRWQGPRDFRRLLLHIAHNRIRDELDRGQAQKRGAGRATVSIAAPGSARSSFGFGDVGPAASTTPSRVAMQKEQAELMHASLASLGPEEREVVLLRLFEDLPLEEVAARAGISVSTAKRRYRSGAARYSEQLAQRMASHGPRTG